MFQDRKKVGSLPVSQITALPNITFLEFIRLNAQAAGWQRGNVN
jgi:hypothetical protein